MHMDKEQQDNLLSIQRYSCQDYKRFLIQFSGIFAVTECQNKAACKVEMGNLEVESSFNHFPPQLKLGQLSRNDSDESNDW